MNLINDPNLPSNRRFLTQVCCILYRDALALTRLQFWTFILSKARILEAIGSLTAPLISPEIESYLKAPRVTWTDQFDKEAREESAAPKAKSKQRRAGAGASKSDDTDEEGEEDLSHDEEIPTPEQPTNKVKRRKREGDQHKPLVPRGWTLDERTKMQNTYLYIFRALQDESPVQTRGERTSDDLTTVPYQGREFTASARQTLPALRMLYQSSGVWSKLKGSRDRDLAAKAYTVLLAYADVVQDRVIRPILRLNLVEKFRAEVIMFLRILSTPRILEHGILPRPVGVAGGELVRFWLPWDWATVAQDVGRVGVVAGLEVDDDILDTTNIQAASLLSNHLQAEITKIAQVLLTSPVFHLAVDQLDPNSKTPRFEPKNLTLNEDLKEPFWALINVSDVWTLSHHLSYYHTRRKCRTMPIVWSPVSKESLALG